MISCTQWQVHSTQMSPNAAMPALPPRTRELPSETAGESCAKLELLPPECMFSNRSRSSARKYSCKQEAVDLISWEAQGEHITSAFSGVPQKIHPQKILPCPFPESCALLWGGEGVPAAQASARPCLPLHSLSLQVDIFYSNSVEQFISCKANSYDSVYHNNRMGINVNKLMPHLIVRRFSNLVSN